MSVVVSVSCEMVVVVVEVLRWRNVVVAVLTMSILVSVGSEWVARLVVLVRVSAKGIRVILFVDAVVAIVSLVLVVVVSAIVVVVSAVTVRCPVTVGRVFPRMVVVV